MTKTEWMKAFHHDLGEQMYSESDNPATHCNNDRDEEIDNYHEEDGHQMGEELIKCKPKLILVGKDGNAFAILGAASKVAKENKMDWPTINKEATSGGYNHLLATMMKYFEVE